MKRASESIEIRRSEPGDRPALERLAALDSSRPPGGAALVASVGRELWAALDLDGGAAIADPFRPSGELVELLRLRAERLAEVAPRRGRRRLLARLRPAT
ncbi:MAG: hypothetical protein ACM3UV_02540 [Nocardioidaceae bacterium]